MVERGRGVLPEPYIHTSQFFVIIFVFILYTHQTNILPFIRLTFDKNKEKRGGRQGVFVCSRRGNSRVRKVLERENKARRNCFERSEEGGAGLMVVCVCVWDGGGRKGWEVVASGEGVATT